MHQVRQLCSKLNSCWASAHNDKIEQTLALRVGLAGVTGAFEGVYDCGTDASRVDDLFKEMRMLVHSWGAEGVVLSTDGHHQLVVPYLKCRARPRRILDSARTGCHLLVQRRHADSFLRVVEASAFCLHELDMRAHVSDRLYHRARFHGADGDRGQERGHHKVVAGRHAHNLILEGVEFGHACHGAPACAKYNNALFSIFEVGALE
mmetsp:Transcript_2738/g.4410  ORF Transcript_2738/g.4410 Transcript_2738/m.4410 type:complete len:206 (-) Transcript_2738:222-839(-)